MIHLDFSCKCKGTMDCFSFSKCHAKLTNIVHLVNVKSVCIFWLLLTLNQKLLLPSGWGKFITVKGLRPTLQQGASPPFALLQVQFLPVCPGTKILLLLSLTTVLILNTWRENTNLISKNFIQRNSTPYLVFLALFYRNYSRRWNWSRKENIGLFCEENKTWSFF